MVATTRIKQAIPEKLPFLEAICWQIENVYANFDISEIASGRWRKYPDH